MLPTAPASRPCHRRTRQAQAVSSNSMHHHNVTTWRVQGAPAPFEVRASSSGRVFAFALVVMEGRVCMPVRCVRHAQGRMVLPLQQKGLRGRKGRHPLQRAQCGTRTYVSGAACVRACTGVMGAWKCARAVADGADVSVCVCVCVCHLPACR